MSDIQELDVKLDKQETIAQFKRTFYKTFNVKLYIYTPSEKDKKVPIGVFHEAALIALHEAHPIYSNVKSLQNRNRLRDYLVYVQLMSYMAHKEGHSKSSIGKYLKRNHATVINSCKMMENGFFTKDQHVVDAYNNIIKHLETYVGTVPENTKSKPDTKPKLDPIWHEAKDLITGSSS